MVQPRLMQERCHKGPCPSSCTARVTVRCDCRRKRAKMACHDVAAALAAQKREGPADPGAAVRLLECDAACQVQPDFHSPLAQLVVSQPASCRF